MEKRSSFRRWLALAVVVSFASLSHCYTNVRAPGPTNGFTTFQLDSGDYQILGPVEAEGTVRNVLLFFSFGGQGFSALKQKALEKGGDDVINVQTDLEVFGLFIFYNEFRWKATGTVIKYRPSVKAPGNAQ